MQGSVIPPSDSSSQSSRESDSSGSVRDTTMAVSELSYMVLKKRYEARQASISASMTKDMSLGDLRLTI